MDRSLWQKKCKAIVECVSNQNVSRPYDQFVSER